MYKPYRTFPIIYPRRGNDWILKLWGKRYGFASLIQAIRFAYKEILPK